MAKVYIPSSCGDKAVSYLREKGYEVVLGTGTKVEELLAIAPNADAVMARLEEYPPLFVANAPFLKIIARHGVGVDNLPLKDAQDAGIWVTNTPYANCDTVAESTIGMLFAVALRLGESGQLVRSGNFTLRGALHQELKGKRIAILGFGKIGSRVAKIAHDGIGMEVVVYDHHPSAKQIPSSYHVASSWMEAIEGADVVTLHMPGDPTLKGMFGKHAFSLMAKDSIFLNLARGSLVDEQALCRALESGHLWGAGLDVYSEEPPRNDSPLMKAPHLLLTPHNGSHTKESMERMAMGAAINIDLVLSGKEPLDPVNHPSCPRNK